MTPNSLKRKPKKVSPKDLKKHSDVVSKYSSNLKVPGTREKTDTGYRVEGFKGKAFETFYEVLLKGTATNLLLHDKKDRTLWVISGDGFVSYENEEEGQVVRRTVPGDCVSLPRGTKYRISTASNAQLEIFVSQSAKYEATLQVLDETGSHKEAQELDLQEPTMSERLGETPSDVPPRRRNSKAAQQQLMQNRGKRSKQVESSDDGFTVSEGGTTDPRSLDFTLAGKNAKPTGGKFDEEGAG